MITINEQQSFKIIQLLEDILYQLNKLNALEEMDANLNTIKNVTRWIEEDTKKIISNTSP